MESVLLYGTEVWGCYSQVGPLVIEQVQMQAARIFLGVGQLHPRVALKCCRWFGERGEDA